MDAPNHDGHGQDDRTPAPGQATNGYGRRAFLKRAGLVGSAAIGSTAVLAACGKAGSESATATTEEASVALGKLAEKYKGKTIGGAYFTTADPNVKTIRDAFDDAVEKAGLDWKFVAVDGQGLPDKCQLAMQSLITKKVDLIYVEGIPPRLIKAELAAAKAAKIPVVGGFTADPLNDGILFDYAAVLESDSLLISDFMLRELNAVHPDKPEIKIAVMDADLDVLRTKRPILDALLAQPANRRIKVVVEADIDLNNLVGSSTKLAGTFLTRHPDLDAIWTNYPNSTIASANVIAQKGKADQTRVYGHIANAAGIEALRQKGSAVSATSWIDFTYLGFATIGYMLDVFAGNEVPKTVADTDPVPATVLSRKTIASQIEGDGLTWEFGKATYRDNFTRTWSERFAA